MAHEVFIDTSGFYALVVVNDPEHESAHRTLERVQREKRRLITTDYVLDETATLLKTRGEMKLVQPLFERVFRSAACRIEWMDAARFDGVREFFLKYADQAWSFTDCACFCTMKELKLVDALTTDRHFEQAGFRALLR